MIDTIKIMSKNDPNHRIAKLYIHTDGIIHLSVLDDEGFYSERFSSVDRQDLIDALNIIIKTLEQKKEVESTAHPFG